MMNRKNDIYKHNKNNVNVPSVHSSIMSNEAKSDRFKRRAKSQYVESSSHSSDYEPAPRMTRKQPRGRRTKKLLSQSEESSDYQDIVPDHKMPAVIVKLNMDPSEFEMSSDSEGSASRKKTFKMVQECKTCKKHESTIDKLRIQINRMENKTNSLRKEKKIYNNKIRLVHATSEEVVTLQTTKILCWWDCHRFKNLPAFLVDRYADETYKVMGCFCSVSCALAYNLYYLKDSDVYRRRSLTFKLYREMYNIPFEQPIQISEAPPRECLSSFGGPMSIKDFRKDFLFHNKQFIVMMPPIKPTDIIVEETETVRREPNNTSTLSMYQNRGIKF